MLSEAGAHVLVTALTDRYLRPLQDDVKAQGQHIDILVADATKSTDWTRTMEAALGLWGHVDVLINNLGDAIRKPVVPLPGSDDNAPMTDEEWHRITDITSPRLSSAAAPSASIS